MSRMKWFGRSLLHLILLLLAVSLVSFLLVSMSPVDPLQTNVGQTALGSMAPEQIEKLQAYWGVGVPVWKRFFSWISGICHGDFGISLLYRRPVLEVIAEKASASVWLLLSAWLFSGIVGIFLGIAAAAKRGKWVDRLITGYCIVIAGTPSFWLALVLLLAALIIESLLGFTPREMAAEWFIFMLGCAYSVLSDLRAGIWDRRLKPNTKTNAVVSVAGGVAVLVWGLIKFAEFGTGIAVLQAVIMGVCTWVLCFALLQLSMKAYKKRHAELENPKEDDDENE